MRHDLDDDPSVVIVDKKVQAELEIVPPGLLPLTCPSPIFSLLALAVHTFEPIILLCIPPGRRPEVQQDVLSESMM